MSGHAEAAPLNDDSLKIRLATVRDLPDVENLVLAGFEPITWLRQVDERFGPLNGLDWKARWCLRLRAIFATQVIVVGESEGQIVALTTAQLEHEAAVAYIDVVVVSPAHQHLGFGRAILRAMMRELKDRGIKYAYGDALADNDKMSGLVASEQFEVVATHNRWFRRLT